MRSRTVIVLFGVVAFFVALAPLTNLYRSSEEEALSLMRHERFTITEQVGTFEERFIKRVRNALLFGTDDANLFPADVECGSVLTYNVRSGPYWSGWASFATRGFRSHGVFSEVYIGPTDAEENSIVATESAMLAAILMARNHAHYLDGPAECEGIVVSVDGEYIPFLSRFVGRNFLARGLPLTKKSVLSVRTEGTFLSIMSHPTLPEAEWGQWCIPHASATMEWTERTTFPLRIKSVEFETPPVRIGSFSRNEFLMAIRWRMVQELATKNFEGE